MIKDMLVSLPLDGSASKVADYATSVAKSFNAHLAGMAVGLSPVVASAGFDGAAAAGLIEAYRAESEKAGAEAITKFEATARRAGLSSESLMLDAGLAGAGDLFARSARNFDLAILAQGGPETNGGEELVIEATLFGSGRPILVVPYVQKQALKLDRVLVCWDGSRAAARAIGDAMPFLERAKSIKVVTVNEGDDASEEPPGLDITRHLARHGIKAEFKRIAADDIAVDGAILSYAADFGADLIVMGGYGHSRLREYILGGATRGMLKAMTAPVLMSH